MMTGTQVLKLGSSVLAADDRLDAAVAEIYAHYRRGERLICVVSALGEHTDQLSRRADAFGAADDEARARLLATGEQQSVAVLCMALSRAGVPARGLDAHEIGLRASGPRLEATPGAVDVDALHVALASVPVLVVPGFVAVHVDGGPALLGRGGSDLTALFLASALPGAGCRLLKDVPYLYESDPNVNGDVSPRAFADVTFVDALACAGKLVQPRALRFAQRRDQLFEIAACGARKGTQVGTPRSRRIDIDHRAPLDVVLLGHGTVGQGVRALLLADPRFRLRSVVTRDPVMHRVVWPELPHSGDIDSALAALGGGGVLIEVCGGTTDARHAISRALAAGNDVVTANKTLMAEAGAGLGALARSSGAGLYASAAVGAAVPMLEAARRVGKVHAIEGVLNGTCNFVLTRLGEGASLQEAVDDAVAAGFAEADSARDLDGRDAGEKLRLLLREAGVSCDAPVQAEPIDAGTVARAQAAARRGAVLRQVACWQRGQAPRVVVQSYPAGHPFAALAGAGNRLRVFGAEGAVLDLAGQGAGRWPTATAVFADLLDALNARSGVAATRDAEAVEAVC